MRVKWLDATNERGMKKINVKLENIDKILENKESLLHNPINGTE